MDRPQTLGASLYVPATHLKLQQVIASDFRSVIICTEDAVAEQEMDFALDNLRGVLAGLAQRLHHQRFVRVRNPQVLQRVLAMPGVEQLTGFVLPKVTADNFPAYFALLRHSTHLLMPTIETAEAFDDTQMIRLRDCLLEPEVRPRILALRIGGNDLFALLGMRRPRNLSLYRTPLGLVIARLVCCFGSHGFGLTAPAFEYLDNPALLAAELAEDLAHGLVGKTAIHPTQIPLIEQHYRVTPNDVEVAQRMMDPGCPAVFKMHNAMCELATHRAWAQGVMERAQVFGISQPGPLGA